MNNRDWPTTLQALSLGFLAGMRSMAAPALLSNELRRHGAASDDGALVAFLTAPAVGTALTVLAAGEMVADKLPIVPPRNSPPALLGRAMSGAGVGAGLYQARGRATAIGAALGVAAAVAGAFAGYELRVRLGRALRLPDPLLGVAEDGLVILGGLAALRLLPEPRSDIDVGTYRQLQE